MDWKVNSTISFTSVPQQNLSNQKFRISEINLYEFKNTKSNTATIEHADNRKFFITDISDQFCEENIAVSRLLNDGEIKSMFDLRQLSLVFSDQIDFTIQVTNIHPSFNNWLEEVYTKEFDYAVGTYRTNQQRTKFYYYTINAKNSSIDIEAFDDGKLLFYSTVHVPRSAIII